MVSIVVSGHGQISTGVVSASDMIFGEQENLVAVPFLKGEGLQNLQEKFLKVLETFPSDEEVLFIVDVFGGTPYNAASQTIFGKGNMDIVTGLSLPIMLEALGNRGFKNLRELVEHLKQVDQESFKVFSEEVAKMKKEEELEDDEL